MRVDWSPDFPPEVREIVEPLLGRWEPALPRWLELVHVVWQRDDVGTLSTNVRSEYRAVTLMVHPGFLEYDEAFRSTAVLHEFLHVHLDPLHQTCHDVVDATVEEDSPLDRWARERIRQALEGATNDLEYAVHRMIDGVH